MLKLVGDSIRENQVYGLKASSHEMLGQSQRGSKQLHSEEAWQNHHPNQGTEADTPSDATDRHCVPPGVTHQGGRAVLLLSLRRVHT